MLNEKKNKFIYILPFIVLPILILTILIGMIFGITNSNNQVAYAEDSSSGGDIVYNDYSFYGNDLFYLGAYRYNYGGEWNGVSFIKFSVNLSSTFDITEQRYITRSYVLASSYIDINSNDTYLQPQVLTAYYGSDELLENKDLYSGVGKICNLIIDSDTSTQFPFTYYIKGDFNSNVKFIQVGSTTDPLDIFPREPNLPDPDNALSNLRPYNVYTYVRYLDNNGNSITFGFPSSNNLTLNNRTYTVGDLDNNSSYELGKEDGYRDGFRDGKDFVIDNFENQLEDAFNRGQEKGYYAGLNETDRNFNLSLFLNGALSMLDVKLFGLFSLGDILMVVIGVSLVIIVLKIFAGG